MKTRFSLFWMFACFLVLQYFPLALNADTSAPLPLVDPLGGLELYSKVEYSEAQSRTFLLSGNSREGVVKIAGDQWVLEAPGLGSIEADRQKMVEYLEGLGADFFEGRDKQNELHAKIREPGNGD